MAWKGLHLSGAARLSFADGQIVVDQPEGPVRMPLEDVAWVVLDTPKATLTSALLAACMKYGVVVVSVDETHTPCGLTLPFHTHHRQADIARRQIESGAPLRKRLWQAVVRAKIENQAAVLDICRRTGAEPLREMTRWIGSGDPDNVEGRAAREYWGRLFEGFVRDDPSDRRNKMLNYGYAVLRSAVARAVVAFGLLPSIGVHHASATNAFNLADDLLEPFRPFVDRLVFERAGPARPPDDRLDLPDRQAMAGILLADSKIGRETVSLLTATEKAAESFVRALDSSSPVVLVLPRLGRA